MTLSDSDFAKMVSNNPSKYVIHVNAAFEDFFIENDKAVKACVSHTNDVNAAFAREAMSKIVPKAKIEIFTSIGNFIEGNNHNKKNLTLKQRAACARDLVRRQNKKDSKVSQVSKVSKDSKDSKESKVSKASKDSKDSIFSRVFMCFR